MTREAMMLCGTLAIVIAATSAPTPFVFDFTSYFLGAAFAMYMGALMK